MDVGGHRLNDVGIRRVEALGRNDRLHEGIRLAVNGQILPVDKAAVRLLGGGVSPQQVGAQSGGHLTVARQQSQAVLHRVVAYGVVGQIHAAVVGIATDDGVPSPDLRVVGEQEQSHIREGQRGGIHDLQVVQSGGG